MLVSYSPYDWNSRGQSNCSCHGLQARTKRFEELVKKFKTRFKSFSLELSGHQDIPPLSFMLRHL